MADLISRSALIRDVEAREIVVHSDEHPFDAMRKQGKAFRECVDNAIAIDAVEVVRCKDCKHWLKDVAGCTDAVGRCEWANYMVGAVGYCVYGERKENE